jgi:hypothetical protein
MPNPATFTSTPFPRLAVPGPPRSLDADCCFEGPFNRVLHPDCGGGCSADVVQAGLMGDMDHPDQTPAELPAVVVPRPVVPSRRAQPQPTRWDLARLSDQLRRASRHPAVASSLATAAGLLLHAGLRWALTAQGRPAQLGGPALTPVPSTVTNEPGVVLFRQTVVIDTWIARHR